MVHMLQIYIWGEGSGDSIVSPSPLEKSWNDIPEIQLNMNAHICNVKTVAWLLQIIVLFTNLKN